MTSSAPIEIRPHATKGRGLYATQYFPPGAIIFPFTPLILLPSLTHINTVCAHCLKPGQPRACTRCRLAFYCDATCQAAAWSAIHDKECKVLHRVIREGRAGLPTPVRAVVQALLKKDIGDGLATLEGNVEARRAKAQSWSNLELMAMGAASFAGLGPSAENLQRATDILCKIQTNSFHRYDVDLGHVGVFLEPTLAMANHSCIPNAMVQFIGRKAILRAETHIQAGQEIEIAYIDYTFPLSKRRDALDAYNFTCQCPRCRQDLNVYQVCAMSPNIELNRTSLVSDIAKLRTHPAATDDEKVALAKKYGGGLAGMTEPKGTPNPLDERRRVLEAQFRRCKPLVSEGFWAVSPLPQVLAEISVYYAEGDNFTYALATACFLVTACDPYRYPAPFHPVRLKGLLLLAKILANTAADTAALSQSLNTIASQGTFDEKTRETLREIDQVSLCQLLLFMMVQQTPDGYADESELSLAAREMLGEISRLPGRDQELSLINAWRQDPENDQSRAFFDYAVVKQVDALASLGHEIVMSKWGQ